MVSVATLVEVMAVSGFCIALVPQILNVSFNIQVTGFSELFGLGQPGGMATILFVGHMD